jgi:hypothetical protein
VKLAPNSFAAALARERGSVWVAEGTLAIPLRRGHPHRVVENFALVDVEDAHLREYYWSDDQFGYVRRRGGDGRTVKLHREVVGLNTGDELAVDHINHDRLDNRRQNLRRCTTAENSQNLRARRGSYSKHRGVSFDKSRGKWVGQVTLDYRRQKWSKRFDTEEEAASAVAAKRRELMPFSTD